MTTTATTDQSTFPLTPVAALTTVVALAGTAFGAHDWGEIAVVAGVVVVAAVLVFGIVVPRALRRESAGGTALALSVPAALLVPPAFWSGLPLVLGVAGLLVGEAGRRSRSGGGMCIAAIALGALAALGYLAIYISEGVAGNGGFLFD